ncbi:hypothetical protein ABL78_5475 [Leptomonas seymouri]|uniref:Uncharacterized protein n=1 Tax=Leptomonas seymouri TaxID=5684 RepID=A0A0N1PBJ8_LEPSE|nr:hypothetical protein ABL78_5475 [Leptomonas seymouri]|eukprot:KPI85454.1 hypothetical protein ABL78_5475 [Leptomonas seymouri]
MTMPALQPPDYLSEVFRFLSSSSRTGGKEQKCSYRSFQSPYFPFCGFRYDNGNQSVAGDANANTSTNSSSGIPERSSLHVTCDGSKVAPKLKLPPLGFRCSPVVPTAARAKAGTSEKAESLLVNRVPTHSLLSKDEALPALHPAVLDHNLPSMKPSVKRIIAEGKGELNVSIGSIELPVEQKPDSKFLAPIYGEGCWPCSNTAPTVSTIPRGIVRTAVRERCLISSKKSVPCRAGNGNGNVGVLNRPLQSIRHAASSFASHHVSIVAPDPLKNLPNLCGGVFGEHHESLVFEKVPSCRGLPAVRRVSLRRPVFDEGDDSS